MGQRSQYHRKAVQRVKRKKRRDRMAKKGENLAEVFYGKFFIKLGSK